VTIYLRGQGIQRLLTEMLVRFSPLAGRRNSLNRRKGGALGWDAIQQRTHRG